jgi:hypothetical protein
MITRSRPVHFADQLLAILTGNFYAEGGGVHNIYGQFADGRIREEKTTIDAYIWWNAWKNDPKPRLWFWNNSPHYVDTCKLLGVDPDAPIRVPRS